MPNTTPADSDTRANRGDAFFAIESAINDVFRAIRIVELLSVDDEMISPNRRPQPSEEELECLTQAVIDATRRARELREDYYRQAAVYGQQPVPATPLRIARLRALCDERDRLDAWVNEDTSAEGPEAGITETDRRTEVLTACENKIAEWQAASPEEWRLKAQAAVKIDLNRDCITDPNQVVLFHEIVDAVAGGKLTVGRSGEADADTEKLEALCRCRDELAAAVEKATTEEEAKHRHELLRAAEREIAGWAARSLRDWQLKAKAALAIEGGIGNEGFENYTAANIALEVVRALADGRIART